VDPLEYLFGLELFGIKFGLENIRTLVDGLGHPDRSFPTLHIAGTNGKGSVTAMVDAVLRAAGFRSARYTSPHLIDLTERFAVSGQPVERAALVDVVEHIRNRITALLATGALRTQPTFFEVTTAAALELFRRASVDIAVMEVGLGGRLDATNVIMPVATAITSIAFDHERYLGRTLDAIAREKAGIIKPGVPVVVGRLEPEAQLAIEGVAQERDAHVIRADQGVTVEGIRQAPNDATRFRLRTPVREYGELALSLRGRHQVGNAVVAVRLLELLGEHGLAVPREAIVEGFGSVVWPGRLEHRRAADGSEMILDAAHNPAGAATLAAYLTEVFDRKLPLVFAAMTDKDVPRMFEALLPSVSALVVTRASNPRSTDPEALARQAAAIDPRINVIVRPILADALAAARALSPRIVIAGSIFLLGDVMKAASTS
jgi:dihydrofolate synthase/folylpolyglutamate synthase